MFPQLRQAISNLINYFRSYGGLYPVHYNTSQEMLDSDAFASFTRKQAQQERMRIREKIVEGLCPDCGSFDSMRRTAENGDSINFQCEECNSLYWISLIPEYGAYKIVETEGK